ncbi:hypothetical protein TNCT_310511 [Trichonephila clavata]|uniref:ISXO2-like transposase domain-containing protein n=1 Tax=Trichonephila clavata TaxID=2740835 RepID=A0A8X6FRE6_TRICU|nr:hypothetical protein TNCT_310511 [Trichonephila clavata]
MTETTLLGLFELWIEPGTQLLFIDCWKSCERLSERGYESLNLKHSLEVVDSETGALINTIEVTWRHFKASLAEFIGLKRFEGYITGYMLRKICFALKEVFSKNSFK